MNYRHYPCYRSRSNFDVNVLCDCLNSLLDGLFRPNINFIVVGDFKAGLTRDCNDFRRIADTLAAFNLFNTGMTPSRGNYQLDYIV